MTRFIRQYELTIQVSPTQQILVKPPFRIQFDGYKSIKPGLNKLNIKIYNLKESTRLQLIKDEDDKKDYLRVIFNAGYDQLQAMFVGNINKGYTSKEGSDFVTTLECFDGGRDYISAFTSKTIKGKQNAIDAIIGDMPNTNKGVISKRNPITRPKVLVGSSSKLIEEQLQKDENFFIDEERVNIIKDNEYISDSAIVINASTGLLNTPTRDKNVIDASLLLNPLIKLGSLVSLETITATHLNGICRVDAIAYNGDYEGNDWKMDVEMKIAENFKKVVK